MEMTLALDWTPNTMHTGFFVARAQGIYERLGLKVTFLSPDAAEDTMSPPARVASGQAMLGLCSSEALIAYHVAPEGPHLMAVATLMQHNTSAIVTLKESGCTCPAQLDGLTYATYGAPLECDVVSHVIRHDGGRGDFKTVTPTLLEVPEALFNGKADTAWIYMGWQGVRAERDSIDLTVFRLEDYGIPYGYAPVLVAHPNTLHQHTDEMCAFVQGSALGYEFAAQHPVDAARILIETAHHPDLIDHAFVTASQKVVSQEYLTREGRWGVMTSSRWSAFWDWICDQHLLKDNFGDDVIRSAVNANQFFTNQFLL